MFTQPDKRPMINLTGNDFPQNSHFVERGFEDPFRERIEALAIEMRDVFADVDATAENVNLLCDEFLTILDEAAIPINDHRVLIPKDWTTHPRFHLLTVSWAYYHSVFVYAETKHVHVENDSVLTMVC